jgi:hypothetical protein
MVQPSTESLTALLLTGCLACSLFASPVIGVAIANGPFLIDRSQVTGNASLFEGSEVVTEEASSKLRLNGGARLEIGAGSQIRVFASRAVLERGAGQVEGPPAYSLQALTLRIAAAAPKAIARVRLDGSDAILVSAFNGPVRVSTAAGLLVATVAPGRDLRFQPGAAEADSFEVTGCLLQKSGRFIVVDSTSNQMFEVRGATDLADKLGNRITVKGTEVPGAQPLEGAAHFIAIQSVTDVAPGGCLATAAGVGADPPPGATAVPKTVAASKGANKAVILGVVIAAAAGGGIAVALSQSKKSASPQ